MRAYFKRFAAVIFVVDSTEIGRPYDAAAYDLSCLLDVIGTREDGNVVPLLVYANKQDLEGARSTREMSEALNLGELRDRRWKINACSAINGAGVTDGIDWLVVSIVSSRIFP